MAFTFVDLFSGIGGFHIACVKNGGTCIGACEIDEKARQIYYDNFGIMPHDDIRKYAKHAKHADVLCAGFPCQSHSTLGKRKGLKDSRGKLFNVLCKYIRYTQPKTILLENVKGLLSSDGGKTFKYILKCLQRIGYHLSWALLDSKNFGLPQHRERVYIVGNLKQTVNLSKLIKYKSAKDNALKHFLDKKKPDENLTCSIFKDNKFILKPKKTRIGFILRSKLSNYTNRKLFSSNGIIGTINTGSPPPIYDERYKVARHLSKSELKACQGFPKSFKFPLNTSRSEVVHYIGNSVSINVVSRIIKDAIAV